MVLNEGISGLQILPTLEDAIPTEATAVFAEVGQDIYYFVKVGNGMFICHDILKLKPLFMEPFMKWNVSLGQTREPSETDQTQSLGLNVYDSLRV